MTTEEAKKYLLELDGYSENDFRRAQDEDVELGIFEKDEWVVYCYTGYPVCEGEDHSAISLAEDHKYWSDPKNVDNYIDFMMSQETSSNH